MRSSYDLHKVKVVLVLRWNICRAGSISWKMINIPLEEILMHVCIDRTLPPVILKITTHYNFSDYQALSSAVQGSALWPGLTSL